MSFDKTIDALLPDWPHLSPSVRVDVGASCATFVRTQLRLAPFHIRVGFRILFAWYLLYLFVRFGLSPDRQRRSTALAEFSALRLPMVGGVERLLRAATMLAFFDQPAVLAAIGEETPSARQQTFRALRAGVAP